MEAMTSEFGSNVMTRIRMKNLPVNASDTPLEHVPANRADFLKWAREGNLHQIRKRWDCTLIVCAAKLLLIPTWPSICMVNKKTAIGLSPLWKYVRRPCFDDEADGITSKCWSCGWLTGNDAEFGPECTCCGSDDEV